jgi:hypothetical protein
MGFGEGTEGPYVVVLAKMIPDRLLAGLGLVITTCQTFRRILACSS